MPYYVAYGSNLHPRRLQQRLPAARLMARLRLEGMQLKFHKRGADGSGKADLIVTGGHCFGALYQLPDAAAQELDRLERGYRRQNLQVELTDRTLSAYTYRARPEFIDEGLQPFDWYLDLLRAGAEALGFAADYRDSLAALVRQPDPNPARRARQRALAARCRTAPVVPPPPWGEAYATSTIS